MSGTYDDEVIYSDRYYAFLDEAVPVSSGMAGASLLPGGYPDVFIGRLPVGRDVELRAVINKMNRMETPQPDDAWRRRVVLFSDDAWSGRGNDYMYRSYERDFERSTDSCAAAVERALPGGFDVQRLHLRAYTDPIHPNNTESGPAVLSKATAAARGTFTPALNKALNRGCLWYMFQGHGNRAVLTTESAYSLGFYMDPDSLRIYTPFIFVGVGCHISDFAIQAEYNTFGETALYGDCMSEQLLFKSGAGAVATYASAGFEYLSQNAGARRAAAQDPVPGAPRRFGRAAQRIYRRPLDIRRGDREGGDRTDRQHVVRDGAGVPVLRPRRSDAQDRSGSAAHAARGRFGGRDIASCRAAIR